MSSEYRPHPVHRVAGLAQRHPERKAGLVQLSGRVEPKIPRPIVGQLLVGRCAGRIHLCQVEPDILFEQVDTPDRGQGQRVRDRRHRNPMAVLLPEIFDRGARLAVFADQCRHQIVGRLPHIRLCRGVPARLADDVVPGAGLTLRGAHQHQLVALAGDEIDREFDLLLRGPFAAELFEHVVGAWHPMVPDRNAELARGVGAAHERRTGQGCGRRRALHEGPPRQPSRFHPLLPRVKGLPMIVAQPRTIAISADMRRSCS